MQQADGDPQTDRPGSANRGHQQARRAMTAPATPSARPAELRRGLLELRVRTRGARRSAFGGLRSDTGSSRRHRARSGAVPRTPLRQRRDPRLGTLDLPGKRMLSTADAPRRPVPAGECDHQHGQSPGLCDRAPTTGRPRSECVASGCGSYVAPGPCGRGCRPGRGWHR
jgi:hypothetical protein